MTQIERPPTIPDAGFGTLEIRLAYDNGTSSLAVTVLRARGLMGMDMTGLSDPFCRLEVFPRGEFCFFFCTIKITSVVSTFLPLYDNMGDFAPTVSFEVTLSTVPICLVFILDVHNSTEKIFYMLDACW